jgi:Glyoxalase/Bleomycin resistance protein/Dioxygenase superfamily
VLGKLDVFHVGLVVSDIEDAMRRIGENLAVAWAPVQQRTQPVRTGAGVVREEPIVFTYSSDGPPHVELIQSTPGSVWTLTPAGCLHHIGAFVDDVTVPPLGMTLEFGGGRGEKPAGFAYYTAPAGIRVELVDGSRREQFEAWFGGGDLAMARSS